MSKKWLVWRALAALIVVGLLVVGGLAVHYVGWSEGYAAGQLAAEGEEGAPAPYGPYGFRWPGRPFGFTPFLFGGALFRIVLLVVLLVVIGKLLRFVAWAIAGGPPMGGPWARHWHRPHGHWAHGPMPPWFHGWQGWCEEEPRKPEAGAQADEAAA